MRSEIPTTPGTGLSERLALFLVLTVLSGVTWFGLGMHRGLLLSSDVKSRVWPWAATLEVESLQSEQLTDPVWQFVPWLQFARSELVEGRLPLWNPHQDGGVPLFGNGVSALLSPLIWPALILGVEHGWNLTLLLRVVVLAAGVWVWLRRLGCSRSAVLLGTAMVALSGPVIGWLEHPHTLALAGAPWLLAGIEGRGVAARAPSAGLIVAGTWLVLVGGHPETALMIALLATARLAVRFGVGRGSAGGVAAAMAGAALAAPALIPLGEYLLLSEARMGVGRAPFVLSWGSLIGLVSPGLAPANGAETAVSVSVVGLGLAAVAVALAVRQRRLCFWVGGSVAIALVVFTNPFSRWLAITTEMYWSRGLLLLPLMLAPLATAALDRILTAMPVRRVGRTAGALAAVTVAVAELVSAAQGVHAVTPSSLTSATTPILTYLSRDTGSFRVLPLHTFLPPNTATVAGLDDVRGYDALAPAGWRRERSAMGRFTSTVTVSDVIEPWDLAAGGAALDFWNVKYLLLHPQLPYPPWRLNRELGLDLREVYNGPDGRILENRRVQPRVRLNTGGEATIEVSRPTRWKLVIDAAADDVLIVANPFFPGWRVELDGKPVRLHLRPGEPIQLPVPAGRHEVELLYRPRSLLLGLSLAGLGAAGLLFYSLRWPSREGYSRQRRWYQK